MAYVLALERGWNPQTDIHFKVIGNFQNLRNSVNDDSTQAFMWETFTTKPYHDNGECSRLGDISTPWPCFMVAGLNEVVNSKLEAIRAALSAIHEAAALFHIQKDTIPQEISMNYGLKLIDAQKWYSGVTISAHRHVSETALERALEALVEAGVLPKECAILPQDLIHSDVAELLIDDIKKVRLYRSSRNLIRFLHCGLGRLLEEQKKVSNSNQPVLNSMQLETLDQRHHYGGVEAVNEAISLCNMTEGSKIINIGSGLGGPCRHIASTVTNSSVLAIELQHDLHSTAQMLTDRCELQNQVTHMAGDFLEVERFLNKNEYDCVVSWLTVLHFNDRISSFRSMYDLLKPGGICYVADLCSVNPLTVQERKDLRSEVYCHELVSSDHLVCEMEKVGFRKTNVCDKTKEWKDMVVHRVENWIQYEESHVKDLGKEGYLELLKFYSMIRDMFVNGNVGGTVITMTKPKGW